MTDVRSKSPATKLYVERSFDSAKAAGMILTAAVRRAANYSSYVLCSHAIAVPSLANTLLSVAVTVLQHKHSVYDPVFGGRTDGVVDVRDSFGRILH